MTDTLHEDELPIDLELVRRLVERDLPRYAALPLAALEASGSTNKLYRLGEELLIRLPRQPGSGSSIAKERRWTPVMAAALPVAVPEILHVGEPGFGYPEPWSVVRWIDGRHPTPAGSHDQQRASTTALAGDLADTITRLREVNIPAEAATEPSLRWYRGGRLAELDDATRSSLQKCRSITGLDLDLDAALMIWEQALLLPGAMETEPDSWYHGDLVAENLLVADGRLVAVLDFGSLSIGDPTIDLHGAWEVLDAEARDVFRRRLDVDDAAWLRGRAWALAIALGAFAYYWDSMPGRRADRLAMARNVLAST